MAKPILMVCSESGSVDHYTNLMSIFNVLEKLEVRPTSGGEEDAQAARRQGRAPVTGQGYRIMIAAVWAQDSDDNTPHEYEFTMKVPGIKGEQKIGSGTFEFSEDKQRHRLFLSGEIPAPPQSGTLQIVNRVRPQKKGQKARWRKQSYNIDVAFHSDG